jgi:hypothetical protein
MSSGSGITRPLRSWLADSDQCLERDRGAATCSLTIAQKSPSNEHDAKCAALGAVVTVLISPWNWRTVGPRNINPVLARAGMPCMRRVLEIGSCGSCFVVSVMADTTQVVFIPPAKSQYSPAPRRRLCDRHGNSSTHQQSPSRSPQS